MRSERQSRWRTAIERRSQRHDCGAERSRRTKLLVVLADRIRDGAPLGVQGLALTALLMNARSSPLYRPGVGSSLPATVLEALEALDYGHRTAGQVR